MGSISTEFKYHYGWGNNFRSESIPDSLPKLGHNPQHPPFNLYTEGMTGTAFTAPRAKNRRSWFYRIRPSVIHYPFEPYTGNVLPEPEVVTPQQLRWDPFEVPNSAELDFVDGLRTICGAGSAQSKDGLAIHHYEFGRNMERKAMYSSDGDFLFVPVKGTLLITTEFGKMDVPQHHIAVVQRSMKFSVSADGPASGYLLEIYKGHFELPELGPIGGNGLANLEDFETPVAAYEDADEEWLVVNKYGGRLFQYKQDHSPYDVVAWMGNYVPYRYDLNKFNAMGSITYDHPDPCISTLLTVPSDTPGTAVVDIAAFGPRWSAVEGTFRPQWFHRNCVTEFMCTISGMEGSPRTGCNLHNTSSAHGPSSDITKHGHSDDAPVGPVRALEDTWMLMFETYLPLNTTQWAMGDKLQTTYWKDMWQNIERHHTLPSKSG